MLSAGLPSGGREETRADAQSLVGTPAHVIASRVTLPAAQLLQLPIARVARRSACCVRIKNFSPLFALRLRQEHTHSECINEQWIELGSLPYGSRRAAATARGWGGIRWPLWYRRRYRGTEGAAPLRGGSSEESARFRPGGTEHVPLSSTPLPGWWAMTAGTCSHPSLTVVRTTPPSRTHAQECARHVRERPARGR